MGEIYQIIGEINVKEWDIQHNNMPGTNDECSFRCYHNLAYTVKVRAGFSLDSRGLVKSLRIESGSKTIMNTTLPNGIFMVSIW